MNLKEILEIFKQITLNFSFSNILYMF